MEKELKLAKAILVPGKDSLSHPKFAENYFSDADLYMFWSEALYDTTTASYSGVLLLHDKLIQKYHLPVLESDEMNYLSVDIKPSDKSHTYLKLNRRGCAISEAQRKFLQEFFESDF